MKLILALRYIEERTFIMALIVKTDTQNIKDSLLKGDEAFLYKEEADKQYVIRINPLHAPLPVSNHNLIRNEDNCYFQLRQWVITELEEHDSFSTQANIQLNSAGYYNFIGIEIVIDRISEIDELSFSKFTDILDANMHYLKPFSVFEGNTCK